ncbi:MAG: DUF4384 domain-containing protein [Thermodesulfobacteriota bacterium]|nr:DUF4384 domain-containing protein [Thermodesulfobacteriota bacterium]
MTGKTTTVIITTILLLPLLSSCVSTTPAPLAGNGSSLSHAAEEIAVRINHQFDLKGRHIQISPNNFWEKQSRINLPFSSVLSDSLSAVFSTTGAVITLQETGDEPLRITGSYTPAGNSWIITARLRRMGASSSSDLAVCQTAIPGEATDSAWFKPKFDRMARTLVRLLESNYRGISSVTVNTTPFEPGASFAEKQLIGKEMEAYMQTALAASGIFTPPRGAGSAQALLTGTYTRSGSAMQFHVSVRDIKNHHIISGASFEIPYNQVPGELLAPAIQTLDDLAQALVTPPASACPCKNGKLIVYTGCKCLYNKSFKAITLFETRLVRKLGIVLSQVPHFTVTDDPSSQFDLALSGEIFTGKDVIETSVCLKKLDRNPDTGKCRFSTAASADAKIARRFVSDELFQTDARSKIEFLMKQLETKSTGKILYNRKPKLVINRFSCENSQLFSKFSDFLKQYAMDFFCACPWFSPVRHVEKQLKAAAAHNTRTIVPVKNTCAQIAAAVNATHYLSGSYWPMDNGDLEIRASLSDITGRVLASDHITMNTSLISQGLLTLPQQKDIAFINDFSAVSSSTENDELDVQLFTQKGRNSLIFHEGEKIIFFIKANRDIYVKLFSKDAAGTIYRIFPNDFVKNHTLIRAGELTAIPDSQYSDDFKFEIHGNTGNEMVFAFASSEPITDLPHKKTGFYGMRQIIVNVPEMKKKFTDYALKRGISLSWDALPILTRE